MPPMRFSASSADRLMTCPGSANLEEAIPGFVPPEKNENGRKGQGKIIHDLMAQIGELPIRDVEKMLEAIQFLATLRRKRRFKLLIEEKMEAVWLSSKPSTTPDLVAYVQDEIHIVDWKTGGVEVEASENAQMMFYARTACHLAPKAKGVWLHIVQPWAPSGVSSWFCDTNRLAQFTADAIATDQKITAHDLTLVPSDACTFCPANPHSRGDKGSKMCPKMMQLLYPLDPLATDEDEILSL